MALRSLFYADEQSHCSQRKLHNKRHAHCRLAQLFLFPFLSSPMSPGVRCRRHAPLRLLKHALLLLLLAAAELLYLLYLIYLLCPHVPKAHSVLRRKLQFPRRDPSLRLRRFLERSVSLLLRDLHLRKSQVTRQRLPGNRPETDHDGLYLMLRLPGLSPP